jgi:hypothetical protein
MMSVRYFSQTSVFMASSDIERFERVLISIKIVELERLTKKNMLLAIVKFARKQNIH